MVAPLAQSPIVAILKLDRVFDESPSGIIFLLMSFGTSEYDPIAVYSFDLQRFVVEMLAWRAMSRAARTPCFLAIWVVVKWRNRCGWTSFQSIIPALLA